MSGDKPTEKPIGRNRRETQEQTGAGRRTESKTVRQPAGGPGALARILQQGEWEYWVVDRYEGESVILRSRQGWRDPKELSLAEVRSMLKDESMELAP